MRVLLTGGTGFLGSHTLRALRTKGMDVRLLVRNPARLPDPAADHVVGDATDLASVTKALDGCDAVVHAASVVALAGVDLLANTRAAEVVLGAAAEARLDPIVNISSTNALVAPDPGEPITADSPVRGTIGTYSASKAAAERVARRLQAEGAPVVSVYPMLILGPDDPGNGPGTEAWRMLVTGRTPVLPSGHFHIVDVRDLASAVVAMVEPGRGPRRYLTTGQDVTTKQAIDQLSRLTGRRLRVPVIPAAAGRLAGRLGDLVHRVVPFNLPITAEAMEVLTRPWIFDDGPTWRELGVSLRPLDETVADLVRWMVVSGRIKPKYAGLLAR